MACPRSLRILGLALVATPVLAMTGCSSTQTTHTGITGSPVVLLGAGDAVGERVRATDILLTGRDAWDRDAVIEAETVRLANLLNNPDNSNQGSIATEPINID